MRRKRVLHSFPLAIVFVLAAVVSPAWRVVIAATVPPVTVLHASLASTDASGSGGFVLVEQRAGGVGRFSFIGHGFTPGSAHPVTLRATSESCGAGGALLTVGKIQADANGAIYPSSPRAANTRFVKVSVRGLYSTGVDVVVHRSSQNDSAIACGRLERLYDEFQPHENGAQLSGTSQGASEGVRFAHAYLLPAYGSASGGYVLFKHVRGTAQATLLGSGFSAKSRELGFNAPIGGAGHCLRIAASFTSWGIGRPRANTAIGPLTRTAKDRWDGELAHYLFATGYYAVLFPANDGPDTCGWVDTKN